MMGSREIETARTTLTKAIEVVTNAEAAHARGVDRMREAEAELELAEGERAVALGVLAVTFSPKSDEAYRTAQRKHDELVTRKSSYGEALEQARIVLETATTAAAEAQRHLTYLETKARSEDDAAYMASEYPRLIAGLTALRARIEACGWAVEAVNKDLPADALPLAWPEALARDLPALPPVVVREERVSRWTYAETGNLLPSELTTRVVQQGDGFGTVSGVTGSAMFDAPIQVVRRQFDMIEYRPATRYVQGPRLADLPLPPLTAAAPAPADNTLIELKLVT